jgi:tetratricopeptide (TPR) repeat protein
VRTQAEEHLALQQWEAAYQFLAPLLRRGINDPEIVVLYARALIGMRQLGHVLTCLENALELYPDSLSLIYEKGRVYLELGQHERALACFERARPLLQSEEELLDLAIALYECERISEAWTIIEPLVASTCHGRLLALAGDCHYLADRHSDAIDAYQRALKYGWKTHSLRLHLAHSLRRTQRYQEAQRHYRRILERDSSDVAATLGLGVCYERLQQHDHALVVYQSGKAWDHCDPRLLGRAGICAARSGQERYAELYLAEAVKQGHSTAEILAHHAFAFEARQAWEDAEKLYRQLVLDYPEHAAGYRGLAWLSGLGLSQELSATEGLEMAQSALERLSDTAGWEILSACEARAGNFERAIGIQSRLGSDAQGHDGQRRYQSALARLRKKQPLNEGPVRRALVA